MRRWGWVIWLLCRTTGKNRRSRAGSRMAPWKPKVNREISTNPQTKEESWRLQAMHRQQWRLRQSLKHSIGRMVTRNNQGCYPPRWTSNDKASKPFSSKHMYSASRKCVTLLWTTMSYWDNREHPRSHKILKIHIYFYRPHTIASAGNIGQCENLTPEMSKICFLSRTKGGKIIRMQPYRLSKESRRNPRATCHLALLKKQVNKQAIRQSTWRMQTKAKPTTTIRRQHLGACMHPQWTCRWMKKYWYSMKRSTQANI